MPVVNGASLLHTRNAESEDPSFGTPITERHSTAKTPLISNRRGPIHWRQPLLWRCQLLAEPRTRKTSFREHSHRVSLPSSQNRILPPRAQALFLDDRLVQDTWRPRRR